MHLFTIYLAVIVGVVIGWIACSLFGKQPEVRYLVMDSESNLVPCDEEAFAELVRGR